MRTIRGSDTLVEDSANNGRAFWRLVVVARFLSADWVVKSDLYPKGAHDSLRQLPKVTPPSSINLATEVRSLNLL